MKRMGTMTKSFISNCLAEQSSGINSRYTYSLPLYSIGIMLLELLENGYIHVDQKNKIRIIKEQDIKIPYFNSLMLLLQNREPHTCKEWIYYFGTEQKIVNELFMDVLKEMEEEGGVRFQSKKVLSCIFNQIKVEYVHSTNSFVDYIQKDVLLKKGNAIERITFLWKYCYAAYMNEQELVPLKKEQTVYKLVQQIQEGVLEGAQRTVLFV
ncbi:hypothetical protein [Bacillus cereus]|uniref:hypothetical protein n=1 Tax=Bacillus cereus TaxID=1396 RepID=UPI000BF2908E|nr:hypothetical protein [Bacillus cereus]PER08750.1 hypothetical protein CN489_25235 [Bacillus cereus]